MGYKMVRDFDYASFQVDDSIHTENPLAQGFNILQGRVEIQVPDVPPGDDYTVVRECKRII